MFLSFPVSSKSYTILFRIFLGIFVLLYFIPVGIDIHKILIIGLPADYVCHSGFCFILFFLYTGSLDDEDDMTNVFLFIIKILSLALIVTSFEYLQLLTPSRSFDPNDLLSNATGMIIGIMSKLFLKAVFLTKGRS